MVAADSAHQICVSGGGTAGGPDGSFFLAKSPFKKLLQVSCLQCISTVFWEFVLDFFLPHGHELDL